MADDTEQGRRTRDAYLSVLGFLSEDAQRELLRYLPRLEACVDEEVAAFGRSLQADLVRRVSDESEALKQRLDTVAEQGTAATCLVGQSESLATEVDEGIDRVAKAVAALGDAASVSAALMRRIEAVGNRMANFPEHRVSDGLRWALDELEDVHGRWRAMLFGSEEIGHDSAEVLAELKGEFEELADILARELASAGLEAGADSAPHDAGGEGATRSAESVGAGPASASPESGGGGESAGERTVEDCVAAMTVLVWQLAHAVQAVQVQRVVELASVVAGVERQAKRAAEWGHLVDRLRRAAADAKTIAETAPKDYVTAVANGIAAAGLDLLDSGAPAAEADRPRWWAFGRRK